MEFRPNLGINRCQETAMTQIVPTAGAEWRLLLWLAILVGAGCAFSLGFACAVPLAAFGAIAALTLDARHAVLLTLTVWAVNQAIGYTVLHYPTDATTLVWGGILGAVAVLSTVAPFALVRLMRRRGLDALAVPASFVCAFAVYEGGLYLVSATLMGGTELYTQAIVWRVLAINLVAFAGLGVLTLLGRASGVPVRRLLPA
jgi:hypothetical protein